MPYNRISIILMMYILRLLITLPHVEQTIQEIDSISYGDIWISEIIIAHLLIIIEQARIKLILFFQYHDNTDRGPPDFHVLTKEEVIDYLLDYPIHYQDGPDCSAYHLSLLYYKNQGSYHKNARFLFGTASQFCR